MSDAAALFDALLKARTAPGILTALARSTWHNTHDGAPCPAEALPTPATLAEWLHNCPEAAFIEATARLDAMTVGAAEWAWTVNRPLPGLSASDATPEVIATDGYYIASVFNLHARWVDMPAAERPRHPLAPIVAAWQARPVEVEPETRRDRRILPVVRPVEREAVLPALAGRYEIDPSAPTLPLFPSRPVAHRVPLLDLVDAAGVPIMARGRGAPLPLRLFVAALLAVRREDRGRESIRLTMPLGDLIAALYPNGWKSNHWPKLHAALLASATYAIHDGRGRWFPVALRYAPNLPDLDALIVLDIAFPPGAESGPTMDLGALNRLSVESSPRWRAAIAANSILWHPGVTRLRVPGRRGRPSKRWGWARDPNAYPIVTLEDRRRLAFGALDTGNRTHAAIDTAWSNLPGLMLDCERAVDPYTGAVGWRLIPTSPCRCGAQAVRRGPDGAPTCGAADCPARTAQP